VQTPDAPNASSAPNQGSAFAGGPSGVMSAVTKIQQGIQALASLLPSLAPMLAEFISKLQVAIPSAVGSGAGQDNSPNSPAITGSSSLPSPPPQGQ
jgi:hypothetical protein